MIFQILNSNDTERGFLRFDNNNLVTYDVNIIKVKDISTRSIKYSASFNIPRQGNESIIDPEIIGDSKSRCIVWDDTMNNILFDGYIHVDLATNYTKNDTFSVSLLDKTYYGIQYITENNIEELFATDTFSWDFDNTLPNSPFDKSINDWFLTTANLNGSNYNTTSSFPVYPTKFIDKNGQLFLTISFSDFLKRVFDSSRANITYTGIDNVKLIGNVTMSDMYLFIPTTFISKPSVNNRDMEVVASLDFVTNENRMQLNSIKDWESQILYKNASPILMEYRGYITGMCDTLYDIELDSTSLNNHNFNIGYLHYTGGISIPKESGNAYLQVVIKQNDIEKYIITFDTQLNDNSSTTVLINATETINNFEFNATDEVSFEFKILFDKFSFYNKYYDNGTLITDTELTILDGSYGFEKPYYNSTLGKNTYQISGLPLPASGVDILFYLTFDSGAVDFKFTTLQNLSPMYSFTTKDTIYLYDSLKPLNLRISDVINDMLNRFNANLTTDSNGNFIFSTSNNRYLTDSYEFISFEQNGITYSYSDDYIGKFSYKNNDTGRIYDQKEYYSSINRSMEHYYIGDVIEYNNGGNNDESISLMSSIAIRNIYGDQKDYTQGELDLLTQINDDAIWGLSTNNVMSPTEIGIMHGFISDTMQSIDIRMPHVTTIYFKDTNGVNTDSNLVLQYTNPWNQQDLSYIPVDIKTILGTNYNLYLGDENGVLDTKSELYNNFKEIFTLKNGNYLQVDYLLSKENIDNILNGYKIITEYNPITAYKFLPTEINGIILGEDSCVVQIKMIKDVN